MTILQPNNRKIKKIIHIGDIHIRLNKRVEEYKEVFEKFFDLIKNHQNEETIICILGDIFHSKIDLQPEAIDSCSGFLKKCADLFTTIIVSGNHDALLTNKNRLDSLTPIVKTLNHSNLFYLKENGLYGLGDILFNNMSIFSDPTEYILYKDISPKYINEYLHHIVLYHGPVNSALTNLGFHLVNKSMPIEIFDGHHIALLGDIHVKQDLQYFDNFLMKPAVHYCGSFLQQNHSEPIDGHGFSLWDLNTKSYTHTNIPNDYGFFTIEINKGKLTTDISNIPKKARVHIKCLESVASEVKVVISEIKKASNIEEISYTRIEPPTGSNSNPHPTINLSDISDVTYQNKLLADFLKNKLKITNQSTIESVISINTALNSKIKKDNVAKNIRWKPKKFEFSNMFSYGENNIIDFSKCKNIMGLFGQNAIGKSAIFDALSFCLFDKYSRGYKAKDVLNVQKSGFTCKFNFEIDNIDFFIEKKGTSNRKGDVKVDVRFWKIENGKEIDLNGEARRNTNDIIKESIGTYEDFILTSFSVQSGKNASSFIDMGQSERKDLVSQFIGLFLFDKLLEIASDECKNIYSSLRTYKTDDYESKLTQYTNELSSLTMVYNDENKQLTELNTKKETLNQILISHIGQLKQIDSKLMSINVDDVKKRVKIILELVEKTKNTVSEFEKNVSSIKPILSDLDLKISNIESKKLEENLSRYNKLKKELDHVERLLDVKKIEMGNKIGKLDLLKKYDYDPACKYCIARNQSSVNESNKIIKELELDKSTAENLLKERTELKNEVESLNWVIEAQSEYTTVLRQRNEVSDKTSRWERMISFGKTEIQNNEKEIESLNRDVEDFYKQTEAIESNKSVQNIIDRLQLDIKNINFDLNIKNKKIMESSGRIKILENQINQVKEVIQKIKNLEKEYESYSLYIKSINRDGLPYMVICNTVPEVEHEVNNILNQIVDFHLLIETDEKNIIPYIVYNDKKWPIEMASGFEKFISSLAIRVALINISNLPRPCFLIIDEGWGTMDSENISNVKILFQFLKSNFDFIVVISHLDFIKDSSDSLIEISKNNGLSKVEYI